MTAQTSRSGFTLLEMLVASLLLGMLVTILTMVFNSSSIAWRTGKAGSAKLSKLRRQLSLVQYNADNVLPRVDTSDKTGYVVSPWKVEAGGQSIHTRAVQLADDAKLLFSPSFANLRSDEVSADPWLEVTSAGGTLQLDQTESYTVGVFSDGPDRTTGTDDDISTWPDEVEL